MSSEATFFPDAATSAPGLRECATGGPVIPNSSEGLNTEKPNPPADDQTENSDELHIQKVCEGSKEALALLFRRHTRAVRNVAYRILRDGSEADDLVQEVFIYVFQKAKLFDPKKGSASSWIIQIAYHRAINRRQFLARRHHYDVLEFIEDRVDIGREPIILDQIAARNLLTPVRGQLSEEQVQTLELHFFEGYTLREIAEKTGQTLGNVRHHYYRGLERLRSNLFSKKDSE